MTRTRSLRRRVASRRSRRSRWTPRRRAGHCRRVGQLRARAAVPTRHSARLAEYHTLPARARAPSTRPHPHPPPPQRLWDEHPAAFRYRRVRPNDLAAIEETHFVVSPGRGSERSCGDATAAAADRGGGGGGGGGTRAAATVRRASATAAYISGLPHDITPHTLCAHIVHASRACPSCTRTCCRSAAPRQTARAAIVDFGGARERRAPSSEAQRHLARRPHASHARQGEETARARGRRQQDDRGRRAARWTLPRRLGAVRSGRVARRVVGRRGASGRNSGSEGGADDASGFDSSSRRGSVAQGARGLRRPLRLEVGVAARVRAPGHVAPAARAREQPVPHGYTYHPRARRGAGPRGGRAAARRGRVRDRAGRGRVAGAAVGRRGRAGRRRARRRRWRRRRWPGRRRRRARSRRAGAAAVPRPTLGGDLLGLFESGECADVAFYLGPDETRVDAHRCVLAARSEYFRLHFARKWPDARETAVEYLNVENPPVFAAMLEFIYSDGVSGARAAVLRDAASASAAFARGRPLHAAAPARLLRARALCAVISLARQREYALAADAHAHGAPALERARASTSARARAWTRGRAPTPRARLAAGGARARRGQAVRERRRRATSPSSSSSRAARRARAPRGVPRLSSRNLESTLEDPSSPCAARTAATVRDPRARRGREARDAPCVCPSAEGLEGCARERGRRPSASPKSPPHQSGASRSRASARVRARAHMRRTRGLVLMAVFAMDRRFGLPLARRRAAAPALAAVDVAAAGAAADAAGLRPTLPLRPKLLGSLTTRLPPSPLRGRSRRRRRRRTRAARLSRPRTRRPRSRARRRRPLGRAAEEPLDPRRRRRRVHAAAPARRRALVLDEEAAQARARASADDRRRIVRGERERHILRHQEVAVRLAEFDGVVRRDLLGQLEVDVVVRALAVAGSAARVGLGRRRRVVVVLAVCGCRSRPGSPW